MEFDPLVGCLLGDDERGTRGGLEVVHIHCDDGLKLEVVVPLGRPGRQIFTQGSINVSTGMA